MTHILPERQPERMDFLYRKFPCRNRIRLYRTYARTFPDSGSRHFRNGAYLAREPAGRIGGDARPDRGQEPRHNPADVYDDATRRAYRIQRGIHLQFDRRASSNLLRWSLVRFQHRMKRYAQRIAYGGWKSGNRNDRAKHSRNRYRRNGRNAYGNPERYREKRAIGGFRLPLSRYRHRNGRLYRLRDTRFDGVHDRTVFRSGFQRNEYDRFPDVEHRRARRNSDQGQERFGFGGMRYRNGSGDIGESSLLFQHAFGSSRNRGQKGYSGNGYGCGSNDRNGRNAIHEPEADEEQQEQYHRDTQHRIVFAMNELLGSDFRFRQRLFYKSRHIDYELIRRSG